MDGIPALNQSRHHVARIAALAGFLLLPCALALAQTHAATEPMRLDAKIPLGPVHGRIDHMAIDVARQRLFVAELGNDSVGVVDLALRKTRGYRVAILWRGDQDIRSVATPYNNRFRRVFEELLALAIDGLPVVYADDIAGEARDQSTNSSKRSYRRTRRSRFTRGPAETTHHA